MCGLVPFILETKFHFSEHVSTKSRFLTNFLVHLSEGHLKPDKRSRTNRSTARTIATSPGLHRSSKAATAPQHRPWRPPASADPRHSCPGEANRFAALGKPARRSSPAEPQTKSKATPELKSGHRTGKKTRRSELPPPSLPPSLSLSLRSALAPPPNPPIQTLLASRRMPPRATRRRRCS